MIQTIKKLSKALLLISTIILYILLGFIVITSVPYALYTEIYDGRMDVVITDTGRRPANSTRVPASLGNVRVLKSNFDLKKAYSIYKTFHL